MSTDRSGDDAGGIVTGWLFRLVLFVAALSFVVFEAAAVAVNAMTVEDAANEVARAAVIGYRAGSIDEAAQAAVDAASERGVRIVGEIVVKGDELSVTVRSTAATLLIDEIDPLEPLTIRETTRTVEWR